MKTIGFTGMPGAGKSEAVDVARALGFEVFSMGELVRTEARKAALSMDDRTIGAFATGEREKHGRAVWAERTADRVKRDAVEDIVIIDGIRSMEEIERFREIFGGDFVLIAIHTKCVERLERILKRSRKDDVKGAQELGGRDNRELSWGIGSAIAKADIMVVNDCSLKDFREEIKKVLFGIVR